MRLFWVVLCFDRAIEDFIIDSIYSKQADAEKHREMLIAQMGGDMGVYAVQWTSDAISDYLISERLRVLKHYPSVEVKDIKPGQLILVTIPSSWTTQQMLDFEKWFKAHLESQGLHDVAVSLVPQVDGPGRT